MPAPKPLGLEGFNRLTGCQHMHLLVGVCPSTLWARQVSAGVPFRNVDALLNRAERVLAELPDTEIHAALNGHPRIGAPPDNPSSAREQADISYADSDIRARLVSGNREYHDKFGYVFLVCTSGHSAEELLTILTERLNNNPETEREVMRTELAKINRLRLQRLLNEPPGETRVLP